MKLIHMEPPKRDASDALAVLDQLRAQVISGQVVAFAAVAIETDDTTTGWCSSTTSVSRLRTIGAISTLLHSFQSGDL